MQKLRYSPYLKSLLICIDIFAISFVFLCFPLLNKDFDTSNLVLKNNLIILFLLIGIWILLSGKTLLYNVPRNITFTLYLEKFVFHILLFGTAVFLLINITDIDHLKDQNKK